MPETRLKLQKPHPAQMEIIRTSKRFNVLCCGRRFGKTALGLDRLIHPALAGEPCAWFAPTYKSLAEAWRDVIRILQPVIARASETHRYIELVTGGKIEMWSLDKPDIARGRKYRVAVVDEAAAVKDLANAWQFVLRPTLTDLTGDAWFLSTPRGMNFFKTLYDRGLSKMHHAWACWQMPTVANPCILPSEVEDARKDLTEQAFNQEYLAQFVNWEGAVFRNIDACATAEDLVGPQEGCEYVFGIDWGKSIDSTVVTIVDTVNRACVAMHRWSEVDYIVQVSRIQTLCRHWQPAAVIAEQNSIGAPVCEALWRAGVPVHPFLTTNVSKANAIEALALAFEQCTFRVIPHPILLGELAAFAAERMPSGLTRYSAPAGQHDDCVMSLALAYSAIQPYHQQMHRVIWESDERISQW